MSRHCCNPRRQDVGCSLDRVRIFQNVAKKDGVIWVLSIPLERERERGGERGGEREREREGEREGERERERGGERERTIVDNENENQDGPSTRRPRKLLSNSGKLKSNTCLK